jgi:hypothetical protein
MKVHDRGKRAQTLVLAVAVAAGAVVTSWKPALAVELTLDLRTVTEAVLFGQSRVDTERRRFHEPYRLLVHSGEIDFIDIVTPYRRVVLAAEDRAAIGDRQFGQRQALALLDAAPQQVDLHVELTFHPLNVYVGVPAYRVALVDRDRTRIEPRSVGLYSRFTPRISDRPSITPVPAAPLQPAGSQPLIGGTMVAGFDGRALDPKGSYDAVISLDGKEAARTRLELGTLR